jgi:UDP-N-acetylmuramate-alanine ligase
VALVTNVEWEHVDMFADEAAVAAAFDRFVARVRPGGALVVCGDDAGARALLDAAPSTVRLVTYGATQREREWAWWAHTGRGNALAFKQPT